MIKLQDVYYFSFFQLFIARKGEGQAFQYINLQVYRTNIYPASTKSELPESQLFLKLISAKTVLNLDSLYYGRFA